jgi:hypothetical protein
MPRNHVCLDATNQPAQALVGLGDGYHRLLVLAPDHQQEHGLSERELAGRRGRPVHNRPVLRLFSSSSSPQQSRPRAATAARCRSTGSPGS